MKCHNNVNLNSSAYHPYAEGYADRGVYKGEAHMLSLVGTYQQVASLDISFCVSLFRGNTKTATFTGKLCAHSFTVN